MTASFGFLPRTRILDGVSGKWTGQNNLFTGIKVYRGPNMAGVWAQEFWEWRLSALWAGVAFASSVIGCGLLYFLQSWVPFVIGLAGFGIAMFVDGHNRAAREIYSHAITYQAGKMLGLPATEEQAIASLSTYPYCKSIAAGVLLERLRADCPKALAWCERHRAKIERLL